MQGFRKCPKPLQQLVSIEEDHHGKASLAANNTIPPLHRSRAPIQALSVSRIPKGLKPTCHKYASSNQTSLQDRHQLRFRDLLAPSYVHLSKRPPSTSRPPSQQEAVFVLNHRQNGYKMEDFLLFQMCLLGELP